MMVGYPLLLLLPWRKTLTFRAGLLQWFWSCVYKRFVLSLLYTHCPPGVHKLKPSVKAPEYRPG